MISFQRLLGREDEFFGLLEASAAECVASITALRAVLGKPGEKPVLDAFAAARRKDKEVTQKLEEMLIHVFVTPIEREDIEELAEKLYKIPKVVEKFAQRYALVFERVIDVRFDGQAEALERAVGLLRTMVVALRDADIADDQEQAERTARPRPRRGDWPSRSPWGISTRRATTR